jgi:hypothetical protein
VSEELGELPVGVVVLLVPLLPLVPVPELEVLTTVSAGSRLRSALKTLICKPKKLAIVCWSEDVNFWGVMGQDEEHGRVEGRYCVQQIIKGSRGDWGVFHTCCPAPVWPVGCPDQTSPHMRPLSPPVQLLAAAAALVLRIGRIRSAVYGASFIVEAKLR